MVEKKHREALKANNRIYKYGKCKPPKQKIKIVIGEIPVKQENNFSILKFHVLSSLPPALQTQECLFTQVVRYPEKQLRLPFIPPTGVECCFPLCSLIDTIPSPQLREGICMRNHTWGILRYIAMGQPRAGTLVYTCPRQQQEASLTQIKV